MAQKEKRTLTISNQRGLHARAAAKFVKLAGEFESSIMVRNRGTEVSGVSIMGLMMLAASIGTEIEVEAIGPDATKAIVALNELVDAKFDEE
ncbi:HPr family phosphocarrier protein [Thalassospira sp.]|uniref:HPr family phosphocarrier protein n=1 Tax=Thalassospira sp. TaxID=1912094 RepID=UPI003AA863C3